MAGRQLYISRTDQWGNPEHLTFKQLNPVIEAQRKRTRERYAKPSERIKDRLSASLRSTVDSGKKRFAKPSVLDWWLGVRLHSGGVQNKFSHAWVFMDRNTDANDNAEHLYRHVRTHHPEINAWFVIEKDTDDWQRLQAEGFRLVAYGSREWKLLILSADHLASSHIDHYVVRPLDWRRYGLPRFHYTFLQHGITKDDLSRWLNIKPIDLFVTVTPAEKQSIAGPGPYKFSDKEVVMTGFPRHDSLLRKRSAQPPEGIDAIVILPTWRQMLLGPALPGSNRRSKGVNFNESVYAQKYKELVQSPRLKAIADAAGKHIVFMPHPNMRPHLEDFSVPPHVRLLSFAEENVQDVLARARFIISDYSSLAFEGSYLGVPVAYFQFDADEFFNGLHIGRRGYFDYARDGYGPVTNSVNGTLDALEESAAHDFELQEPYRERVASSFPTRDENNSERVVQAMRALDGGPRLIEPRVIDLDHSRLPEGRQA
ncbi:hypothetical protein GCM10025867_37930 [Frondihabitans sucicola]|uniref:Uncharacterized protein n=1 Tax=Frondihabitans sucicola TaxID=1268041 RepID=A0ABM8GSV8_9MICO|nr:CDP-glycerol glycerophosphotransferase family protein [Frondihabitans sucicola]BDZ51552.1 hypothetical protein GCM10025867_37930 [Frondihabitans sucicola]